MEIPKEIKEFALNVAKYGNPGFYHVDKDLLQSRRQALLNDIEQYKKMKKAYLEQDKKKEEVKNWLIENGVELLEPERDEFAAGCSPMYPHKTLNGR